MHAQDDLLAFLGALLDGAGLAITACTSTDLAIARKQDRSLVTAADLASERVILDGIKQVFADHYVYSEESGCSPVHALDDSKPSAPDWKFAARQEGDYVWIIDPLDGTTNFANNYPFYCVSIAVGKVQSDGRIVTLAGGVHNPVNCTTYLAYRGGGAFCNGKRLQVVAERELEDSFLATGLGTKRQQTAEGELICSELSSAGADSPVRCDGAAALDLALVARGIYDGFWEQGLKPWDVAAGWLLVTEAGGEVRNYVASSDFNIEGGNVIAGNAATVARLAQLINHE